MRENEFIFVDIRSTRPKSTVSTPKIMLSTFILTNSYIYLRTTANEWSHNLPIPKGYPASLMSGSVVILLVVEPGVSRERKFSQGCGSLMIPRTLMQKLQLLQKMVDWSILLNADVAMTPQISSIRCLNRCERRFGHEVYNVSKLTMLIMGRQTSLDFARLLTIPVRTDIKAWTIICVIDREKLSRNSSMTAYTNPIDVFVLPAHLVCFSTRNSRRTAEARKKQYNCRTRKKIKRKRGKRGKKWFSIEGCSLPSSTANAFITDKNNQLATV